MGLVGELARCPTLPQLDLEGYAVAAHCDLRASWLGKTLRSTRLDTLVIVLSVSFLTETKHTKSLRSGNKTHNPNKRYDAQR